MSHHPHLPHRHPHPPPPERLVVVIRPQIADPEGHPDHGPELRRTTVRATGEEGVSGYPRYAGEGVAADIDPRTRTVEAVTVDGGELPYDYVALVADDVPETEPRTEN